MAITAILPGGNNKLRAIEIQITKPANAVLGPGGATLTDGQQVRVPEADAHTLVSAGQARFIKDSDSPAKAAGK
jgi:hypothetical protein